MEKEYIPLSQISVTRTPDGGYLVSTIQGIEYKKQRYYGYAKRDAVNMFREDILGQPIRRRQAG